MKCGFYEADITPCLGDDMLGYHKKRVADGVHSKLFVKAAAVEINGVCGIVISVDLLWLAKSIHDTAVARIAEATGIPSERVLIHATHTHTGGPASDISKPVETFTPVPEYTAFVGKMVGDCGILAYQRLQNATAKAAKKDVHGVSFIRNYKMKDGRILMNPGWQNPDIIEPFGTLDPELSALFFYGEGEKPMGALVNFAMHHDCVSAKTHCTKYCSDYSGIMAEELKKTFGPDFVMVMVNGCCGNVNHFDVSKSFDEFFTELPYLRIGKRLADEVRDLYAKAEPLEMAAVGGKKVVVEIERRKVSEEELEEFKRMVEKYPNPLDAPGGVGDPDSDGSKRRRAPGIFNFIKLPDKLPMTLQALRIGGCMFYAVCGETYSEFGLYMKEHSPLPFSMVAELANGGDGCYIPTREAFGTTLYEAQIPSSKLVPDGGYIMADTVLALANEIMEETK